MARRIFAHSPCAGLVFAAQVGKHLIHVGGDAAAEWGRSDGLSLSPSVLISLVSRFAFGIKKIDLSYFCITDSVLRALSKSSAARSLAVLNFPATPTLLTDDSADCWENFPVLEEVTFEVLGLESLKVICRCPLLHTISFSVYFPQEQALQVVVSPDSLPMLRKCECLGRGERVLSVRFVVDLLEKRKAAGLDLDLIEKLSIGYFVLTYEPEDLQKLVSLCPNLTHGLCVIRGDVQSSRILSRLSNLDTLIIPSDMALDVVDAPVLLEWFPRLQELEWGQELPRWPNAWGKFQKLRILKIEVEFFTEMHLPPTLERFSASISNGGSPDPPSSQVDAFCENICKRSPNLTSLEIYAWGSTLKLRHLELFSFSLAKLRVLRLYADQLSGPSLQTIYLHHPCIEAFGFRLDGLEVYPGWLPRLRMLPHAISGMPAAQLSAQCLPMLQEAVFYEDRQELAEAKTAAAAARRLRRFQLSIRGSAIDSTPLLDSILKFGSFVMDLSLSGLDLTGPQAKVVFRNFRRLSKFTGNVKLQGGEDLSWFAHPTLSAFEMELFIEDFETTGVELTVETFPMLYKVDLWTPLGVRYIKLSGLERIHEARLRPERNPDLPCAVSLSSISISSCPVLQLLELTCIHLTEVEIFDVRLLRGLSVWALPVAADLREILPKRIEIPSVRNVYYSGPDDAAVALFQDFVRKHAPTAVWDVQMFDDNVDH